MPLKSVLEIDVQDERFVAFQTQFNRYQEAVASLPGAWGKIANGTDMAATALDSLGKKAAGQHSAASARALMQGRANDLQKRADGDALTRMGKLQKGTELLAGTVGRTSLSWKTISGDTKKVFDHIDGATKSLMKWSLMKGIFAGLTGAGGSLFGIDKLAGSAAAGRRSAAGLGISFGEQRAFSTDFGRFVDADSMLSNVASAKTDITSPAYQGLLGAGLTGKQIQGGNAADVSIDFLHRLPQMFKGVQPGLIGPNAEARGLTNIISAEDIKRYVTASPQERAQQDKAYTADKTSMNVGDGTLKGWTDLNSALTRASTEIEKAFITGLAPLAPEIADLSKGVVKLVSDFTKSKEVKEDLDALVTGLGNFEKAINDPDSWWNKGGKALDGFAKKEKEAGDATHSWLKEHAPWATADYWFPPESNAHLRDRRAHNARATGQAASDAGPAATGTIGGGGRSSGKQSLMASEAYQFWRSKGLDHAHALGMVVQQQAENNFSNTPGDFVNGQATAFGPIQWHSDRAKLIKQGTGIDVTDPNLTNRQALEAAYYDATKGGRAGFLDRYQRDSSGLDGASDYATKYCEGPRDLEKDQATRRRYAQMWDQRGFPSPEQASAAQGIVPTSPSGTIGDRAAFEAEQRRAAGQANANDAALLAAYKQQQATPTENGAKGNLLNRSKRFFGWADRASKLDDGSGDIATVDRRDPRFAPKANDWSHLANGRTKDDAVTGQLRAIHAETKSGNAMFHDALMGSISAKTKAFDDRMFSPDDMTEAVKKARGTRPGDDQGSNLDTAKGKSSGLGFDKLHQKRGYDITINNASGADVSMLAGQRPMADLMILHPGVTLALKRLVGNELDVARMMVTGELSSPQHLGSLALFNIRVTGTGLGFRQGITEHVWRNSANYLNDEFLTRCNGLPVLLEHPAGQSMRPGDFAERAIGTVFVPYISGDEVWAIAKIYDQEAAQLMEDEQVSTSPSVVFHDPKVNDRFTSDDGTSLLFEGIPSLIDHVAIVRRGVWDKQGDPSGVRADSAKEKVMADDNEGKEKDGGDDRLDKVLAHLAGLSGGMEELKTRMNSFEGKAKADAAAKKDEETEEEKRARLSEDRDRADSASRKSRADSLVQHRADDAALAGIQGKADSAFGLHGKRAPMPLEGETPLRYRVRMANELKRFSPALEGIDLGAIALADAAGFEVLEGRVYADSAKAAERPEGPEDGGLIMRERRNPDTGGPVREFFGRRTFVREMSPIPRAVLRINAPGILANA